MMISRHLYCPIDVAMVAAFVAHRYPAMEFETAKQGQAHTVVIDGFAGHEQLAQFTHELKQRTGVEL